MLFRSTFHHSFAKNRVCEKSCFWIKPLLPFPAWWLASGVVFWLAVPSAAIFSISAQVMKSIMRSIKLTRHRPLLITFAKMAYCREDSFCTELYLYGQTITAPLLTVHSMVAFILITSLNVYEGWRSTASQCTNAVRVSLSWCLSSCTVINQQCMLDFHNWSQRDETARWLYGSETKFQQLHRI